MKEKFQFLKQIVHAWKTLNILAEAIAHGETSTNSIHQCDTNSVYLSDTSPIRGNVSLQLLQLKVVHSVIKSKEWLFFHTCALHVGWIVHEINEGSTITHIIFINQQDPHKILIDWELYGKSQKIWEELITFWQKCMVTWMMASLWENRIESWFLKVIRAAYDESKISYMIQLGAWIWNLMIQWQ